MIEQQDDAGNETGRSEGRKGEMRGEQRGHYVSAQPPVMVAVPVSCTPIGLDI